MDTAIKTLSFNKAVVELVDHIVTADPLDQGLVMLRLRRAIENVKQPAIDKLTEIEGTFFQNFSLTKISSRFT